MVNVLSREYIQSKRNVILVGGLGTRKTHLLATTLGLQAAEQGNHTDFIKL